MRLLRKNFLYKAMSQPQLPTTPCCLLFHDLLDLFSRDFLDVLVNVVKYKLKVHKTTAERLLKELE